MQQPTNIDFLNALFGADAPWVHVTDFSYDPNEIPKGEHLRAWAGDFFSRYHLRDGTNQYFTISNFYTDDQGKARRRKALYRHTPVIVLDDVREKLSVEQAGRLPAPAWVLETSPGSEQWGYILTEPCTDRSMVENLLDGLVANGLAPEGRDPGMKGVTRYVRLPEGCNTKASKMVHGQPYKCRMLQWQPFSRVTMDQLAAPFNVDLHASRREARVDGAAAIDDHPLLNIPDIIHIKEVRSDGRFDVTCPWVGDHTGADDSGAAVFTNSDSSIGFKCHHGACQGRTGRDLLVYIEDQFPGFGASFNNWKVARAFSGISEPSFLSPAASAPLIPEPNFLEQAAPTVPTPPGSPAAEPASDALQSALDQLRRMHPASKEARETAAVFLKLVDGLPKIEQLHWHGQVCDVLSWSKSDFRDILKDLRQQWYGDRVHDAEFYDSVLYVKEQNQFYDWKSRIFFTVEAFQNSFNHLDADARKVALENARVQKVDRLDYAPRMPRVFAEGGVTYGNAYMEDTSAQGQQGDASPWLRHFEVLGWEKHRKHVLQWMAYTIKFPERKINHMLLMGSGEGCGKDWLLYPLVAAMGSNSNTIDAETLLEGFNEYILSTKHLHINEAELGDRREAMAVSNKLKPLAAAPPDTLRMNPKGTKPVRVRNILNATMTTNSQMPLRLNGPSRRFYAIWSDFNPRDDQDNMRPEWLKYWREHWDWMRAGGFQACIWHLRNEVDLSDFDPGAAPPMTQFLRDIREASKPPMVQALETAIVQRSGCFRMDLVTAEEILCTMRSSDIFGGDSSVPAQAYTKQRIVHALKQITRVRQVEGLNLGDRFPYWVCRDVSKYQSMDPNTLYHERERQVQELKDSPALTVVK